MGAVGYAQQDALLDFQSFGDIYNNPAHIVHSDVWLTTVGYHNALPGYQDGPQSYYLTMGGPIQQNPKVPGLRHYYRTGAGNHEPRYGLGAYILSDACGYYRYNSAMLNYAQKFKLSKKDELSFGIALGIYSAYLDKNKMRLENNGDPAYMERLSYDGRFTMGDLNFGIIYASDLLQAGFSVKHMLGDMVKLGNTPDFAQLNEHFTFFGKTKIYLHEELDVIPGLMGTYTEALPLNVKLSVPFVYQEKVMGGIAWTPQKTVSLEVGFLYKQLVFGYSFAINTSRLSMISGAGHQIGLRYVLPFWSYRARDYTLNQDLF